MSRFVKRFGLSFTIALAMFIARSAQAQCLSPPLETATLTSEEDGAVFVQWLGPIGVCPQLGDDFTVSVEGSGPLAPASITLKTLNKNGVQVTQWILGRKRYEPLPGNFITRDLGKVDTVWSGGQNDGIIVRIGTVADYPVAVLQGVVTPEHPEGLAVDIAAPGSVGGNNPWSSVEIQTVGDVKGSVFAYANTNLEGGRIRGVIGTGGGGSQGLPGQNGDDQPKIDVQGIGEGIGGGTPGSPIVLRVTGNIWNMRLKELGEGSRLEAGGMTSSSGIGGLLNIRGPLDGVIRLGSLSGTGGPQPTKIHVEALGAGGAPAESHGKIIIAGGDLSDVSFFPCDQCNTSGWTADAGFEITDRLRISCAPPRHGRGEGRHTVCEVWPWWNSADQTWEIFVPASLTDPLEIAAGIASALVHVRTGPGFGAAYRRMAGAVDLKGLKTPVAGPNLRNRINGFLPDLGRYPHAALDGHP